MREGFAFSGVMRQYDGVFSCGVHCEEGPAKVKQQTWVSAMRELPPEERPRERLKRLGPEALRDAELIAVLFRTGTREYGAVALADKVVGHFGGLRRLGQASLEELQQVKGLGGVKAIEIKAALELGKRLAVHTENQRPRIKSAEDVVRLLMVPFKECETEQFKCLLLNAKNEVQRVVDVASGGLDATLAMPRDVFRMAIRDGAGGVIVCHNHPSGDPEPSREDVDLTKRLSQAADILGLRMLDHIVFGDGRFVSLKERGLM
ncbi:MAG TPA: DNA repair protein RadC [Candidatus Hydrogenedentes bacterium]|nr:DNA repair protein RadC [Candidatus Hydrogenedentota bacterium]